MTESDQREYRFDVDKEKAMRSGVAPAQIASIINSALSNMTAGILHDPVSFDPVNIVLRLKDSDKGSIDEIKNLTVLNQQRNPIQIGDLVQVTKIIKDKPIYRKNQKRVVFVMADLAGRLEGPFYAMMDISGKLGNSKLPKGYQLKEMYSGQPEFEDNYTLKWMASGRSLMTCFGI